MDSVFEKIKIGIGGAVAGAIVLAIVGFNAFNWKTEGGAKNMADQQSKDSLVSALVPICMIQAKVDPKYAVRLTALDKADYWKQGDELNNFGWAVMPGSQEPTEVVAEECAKQLLATIKKK